MKGQSQTGGIEEMQQFLDAGILAWLLDYLIAASYGTLIYYGLKGGLFV